MIENIGKRVMKKSAKTFSGNYFDVITDVRQNPDSPDIELSYFTSTGSYLTEEQTVFLVDSEHFQYNDTVYNAYEVLAEYPVRHKLHKIALRYLYRVN